MTEIQLRNTSESSRDQLLDTAEGLFLEQGLAAVSLRAIARHAGQRNPSALQYHFGGRQGLINAILHRRMTQLDERRVSHVERLQAAKSPSARDCLAAIVGSAVALCADDERFRKVIGLLGKELLGSGDYLSPIQRSQSQPNLRQLQQLLVASLAELPAPILRLRFENAQGAAFLAISRRAQSKAGFRGVKAALFVNNLVDQVAAMLSAPVSESTQAALAEKGVD